jgi:ABC-type branched-subunit amino acid transport system substrate-binding protein
MRPAVLAAGMIACVATSCSPTSTPSQNQVPAIVIGSDLPTSGFGSVTVVPLRAAIALAIANRGSIDGYRLVYEPFDDTLIGSWSPLKGEQNARIMTRQPDVLAMIGPYNSQVAQREIPVTNQAELVMISPSNTVDCPYGRKSVYWAAAQCQQLLPNSGKRLGSRQRGRILCEQEAWLEELRSTHRRQRLRHAAC